MTHDKPIPKRSYKKKTSTNNKQTNNIKNYFKTSTTSEKIEYNPRTKDDPIQDSRTHNDIANNSVVQQYAQTQVPIEKENRPANQSSRLLAGGDVSVSDFTQSIFHQLNDFKK